MLEQLVALITAPLFLAVTKKKKPAAKRAVTKTPKRPPGRPRARSSAPIKGPAAKKGAPTPRPEPAPEAPPRPPEPKPVAPSAAPGVFSPRTDRPAENLTPSFRWFYVGGATRYEVEWSPEPKFLKTQTETAIADRTLLTLDEAHALKPGATYVWRVRGGNEAGWGPWSPAESFRAPEEELRPRTIVPARRLLASPRHSSLILSARIARDYSVARDLFYCGDGKNNASDNYSTGRNVG